MDAPLPSGLENRLLMAQADLRKVERARERRDQAERELEQAIVAAWESGESYRDIAKRAGLTFQRIGQIVTAHQRKTDG
jgi:DNA-binding protein H-NS